MGFSAQWMVKVSVISICACSGLAFGQNDAKPKQPEFTKGTVIAVEFAGLPATMSDPKDQAMAAALGMIPARVRELPREIKDIPPEVPRFANLALTTIAKPMRFSVTYNGENPAGGFFGYGITLSVLTGEQSGADELHAAINPMIAQSGMRLKSGQGTRFPGMTDIQTPVGLGSFGPRQAKDGWRYEIAMGTVESQDAVFAEMPAAPAGLTPIVRARVDMAGFAPLQQMGAGMAGQNPQMKQQLERLDQLGIFGGNASRISYIAGYTKNECVSFQTIENAKASRAPVAPISADEFAAIPSDATDAMLTHSEFVVSTLIDAAQSMGVPELQGALDQFRDQTGVDLKNDLLASIGSDFGFYNSYTTGGNGFGSFVAMISLKDRAKFTSAMGKLAAFGNTMADKLPMGAGYVRIVSWKDGDSDLMTLRFPGLPVPLELTMGMSGKWLLVSPTIQGTLAATRQAAGKGDGGLMANAVFKSRFPSDKKVVSISFSDTAAHLHEGYDILSLAGSAVANMVRSPIDPAREPGLTVPLYNDLKKDVQPRVSYTYWRGNDLVSESHSDKSMMVAMCGMMGTLKTIAPLVAIPALVAAKEQGQLGLLPRHDVGFALARAAWRLSPDPQLAIMALIPEESLRQVPALLTEGAAN